MIGRLALRDRLAVSFTLALVLAYALMAACVGLVVARALERSIDGRLSTVAQAVTAIADDPRSEIDDKDRAQFASITADATGAAVIDADGNPVMSTVEHIPPWVFDAAQREPRGVLFALRVAGREVRVLVEQQRRRGVDNRIVVWESLAIAHDLERTLFAVLAGFGVALALGGYAIGAAIARRGLVPLTQMSAVMADIAAQDLQARVGPQPHRDEIGQLAGAFDRMLDRLQAAFERQRRFTADASHDLRAPLATLRAEVELALRRERTSDEYRAALAAIGRDADQLDALIDALLAAARSETGALAPTALDLATVAQAAADEIAPFANARHIRVQTQIAPAEIDGDAALLARATLAVVHNAVKFSPPGGRVTLTVERTGERAELRVRDEGAGFSDAALRHATERFWRDDAARGRGGGSGLGLAIAGEIARRCGGNLALRNAADGGAEVVLAFPLRAPKALVNP